MFFAYTFLARAVAKASDYLADGLDYGAATGDAEGGARTRGLVRALLVRSADHRRDYEGVDSAREVLTGFDEQGMFRVTAEDLLLSPHTPAVINDPAELAASFAHARAQKDAIRASFREKFLNISRLMDCVTCEKCRLWGKLQVLGFGTALKVLFDEGGERGGALELKRNEVVALVNTLHRLSESVRAVATFRALEVERALAAWRVRAVYGLGVLAVAGVLAGTALRWRARRRTVVTAPLVKRWFTAKQD